MRVSSAQASPHYLSGPHLSWLLLTICYARSFASPPSIEPADPDAYVGLEEAVSADLAVYLLRAWDESEPPPSCLQDLCSALAGALSRGALIRSRSSSLSPSVSAQIKNTVSWLVYQWDMLGTGGIPSIASGWLVKIIEAAGGCLEGEEPIGGGAIRPLERRSPLAIPIRRMRLAHESLDEIKDLTRLFKVLQAWRDNSEPEVRGDPPVGSSGRPSRIDVYAAYQEARKRGDYTATRENLTKFFELAPISVASSAGPQPTAVRKTKIHPHALLNFAALQVESHEWDAAEQTLHETIQLARTERDEQCLQACQSLERRIKAARAVASEEADESSSFAVAQDPWRASDRSIHAGSLSLDDLWEIETCARAGASSDELLRQMERVYAITLPPSARPGAGHHQQHPTHHKGPQVATGEPSKTIIAQDRPRPWTVAASLSETKGDAMASDRYRHVYRSEPYHGDEERRDKDELMMRMQEAWQSAESGSYEYGLALLVNPTLIENMSLADYQTWAQLIWRILYLQRSRRGDTSADTDHLASQALVGEVGIRLVNAPAHLKRLYGQAKSLVVAGAGDVALSAVRAFITAAETASAAPLVLEGKLLECRVLAENMGRYENACEALEEVMVQVGRNQVDCTGLAVD